LCSCLGADQRSAKQSLKRHAQQNDQGSLTRQQAVAESVQTIKDLDAAIASHEEEAGRAIEHHNQCVSAAASKYGHLQSKFLEILDMTAVGQQLTSGVMAKQAAFINEACDGWLDVSSDYQQDKQLPSWHESPQPGLRLLCEPLFWGRCAY